MKIKLFLISIIVTGVIFGCHNNKKNDSDTIPANSKPLDNKDVKPMNKVDYEQKAEDFLKSYNKEYAILELAETTNMWTASNSGKKEDWNKYATAKLKLKKFHSDKKSYKTIISLLEHKQDLKALTIRSLEVAKLAFAGNQLTEDILKKIVNSEKEIEKNFASFRGKIGKKVYSNNQLLEMLKKEKRTKKRKEIWEALKQVGAKVGPQLVALAKIRNQAAKTLGFKNYWYMQIKLQEHDPAKILALFEELEKLTREPFKKMKAELDKEISKKLRVKSSNLMPWHYDNPFFQEAPPSPIINLDSFFKKMKKEDIVELARKFFNDIGLPIDDIIKKSDYYERKGKDQHAFCITINRKDDIRTLLNIKPTDEWMGTMLHESGHAVYYKYINRKLPFNLREAGHILMTEGVAMLFGALAKNPKWLIDYAKADPKKVKKVWSAIINQRKREQLIFTRWTIVMLNFEKALYDNPDQDLNKLWWDMVEKYQMVKRPKNRNAPDWAAKPHFTIAPVYYHNYMMGELYAAQMRASLAKLDKFKGPVSELDFKNKKSFGKWFIDKVFKPGEEKIWNKLVIESTGHELSAKDFANEIK